METPTPALEVNHYCTTMTCNMMLQESRRTHSLEELLPVSLGKASKQTPVSGIAFRCFSSA